MRLSVRIATFRTIDIKIHASLCLAFLWAIWYWGVSLGLGVQGALFGLFLLCEIFICVIGHELAHGYLALRYGFVVHDITLLPIGGVARIEHSLISPRKEAAIALAGPLLNLVVAAGLLPFVLLVLISRHITSPIAMLELIQETGFSGMLVHLLLANIMLAVFNLLPAFPMDGGRVLRAGLSVFSGRVMATRIAVLLGQGFALLLLVAGIYTRDLVLPMVAVFIIAAAYVESTVIDIEAKLRKLQVGQFALWDMGGISPDSPVSYAVSGGSRDVAVTSDGKVIGMLWRDDVLRRLPREATKKVREIMDTSVVPVTADSSIYDAHRRMVLSRRPAIPIVENGLYRGIFTSERLVHVHRHLQDHAPHRERYRGIAVALGLFGR
ncbi:MAG TPA: site-2 protease family protein [Nitrolancea sp.]|nr:site-2 protease family protein [Nitrolancea sp.]